MSLELKKANPARLRSLNLDERWLQDRIEEDASLLGLGDLHIIKRERTQITGGRIDFLMYDPENEIRFEIEIMLGTLDESHIIRTIEYWDIERQRFPTLDHRAVIVAEEITSRFFNVIRLLNRAVPLIALQLNAFHFEDSVVLHFTKVLDVYESGEEEEERAEQTDRRYWEKQTNSASFSIVDRIISMVSTPRVTYNKYHIALGTTDYNFCWFHPRRSASHCYVHLHPRYEDLEMIVQQFEDAGLGAGIHRSKNIKFKLTVKDLERNSALLKEVISKSEKASRIQGSEA